MKTGVQKEASVIKTEFNQILKDFSEYLHVQKQTGNTFLNISKDSQDLINGWGANSQIKDFFFFEGPQTASIFIIDSEGAFFKGKSGGLLKKILRAMTLSPEMVFICNADDIQAVSQKISAISPEIIITLGEKAGQSLLNIKMPLEQIQGKFYEYDGIKVMPTFHPSLLLEQPDHKRQVWDAMKHVMEYLGLKDDS
ncbi:MAG: uracil-DNA glycosylase [Desulfobacteraceae bacterium]|nr:uracil-DNA glycosylase [Desulfobacteraceae bacterium]